MTGHLRKLIAATLCFVLMVMPVYGAEAEKTAEAYGDDFQAIMEYIDNYYLEDVSREELFNAAVTGMFSQLDRYSTYIAADDSESFLNSINNTYVGIGVVLVQSGDYVKIERVFIDGPADGGGVEPGDLIVEIDGESAEGFTILDCQRRLLGEEGTEVTVTFNRGGAVYTILMVRDTIVLKSVEASDLGDVLEEVSVEAEAAASYVLLETFSSSAASELKAIIEDEKEKRTSYLILDLRNNGGGYVDTGIQVINQLVPEGPGVTFVNNAGRVLNFESDLREAPFELVVLVNSGTASASEFVAAAIQESGQGILVGETTFGKGVAQNIVTMEDGSMIKLTTEEFLTGNGLKINGVGVTPDVVVDLPDYIDTTRRLYLTDFGDDVLVAERILEHFGYSVGAVDGQYDRSTYNAVKQFQADQGLYPYGVCDYTTQKSLNDLLLEDLQSKDTQLEKAYEVLLDLLSK